MLGFESNAAFAFPAVLETLLHPEFFLPLGLTAGISVPRSCQSEKIDEDLEETIAVRLVLEVGTVDPEAKVIQPKSARFPLPVCHESRTRKGCPLHD